MDSTESNSRVSLILRQLDSKPPSSCQAEIVDFSRVGLKEYADCFAMLVHNAFSPKECRLLLEAAESSAKNKWEQALVNVGCGEQILSTDIRLCDRILWDNHEVTSKILDRVLPHIPENIATLQSQPQITGRGPVRRKEIWKISRINERMRFLKYTRGMYFRLHCDGSYVTPDNTEISFLTIHLYLNGGGESEVVSQEYSDDNDNKPLVGGATRFFGMREDDTWDVNPKIGSVLVFQHRDLFHSGEDVLQGTKYTMRSDIMYSKVEE